PARAEIESKSSVRPRQAGVLSSRLLVLWPPRVGAMPACCQCAVVAADQDQEHAPWKAPRHDESALVVVDETGGSDHRVSSRTARRRGPCSRPDPPLPLTGDDGTVPDLDVESYLAAVVTAARQVLGTQFFGAYAAGSLALEAFHPGRSDIDLVLLCHDPLNEAVKRELTARVRLSALPCPARCLEL